jgi:CubicO group peptidase (beta-lactamase class C family)
MEGEYKILKAYKSKIEQRKMFKKFIDNRKLGGLNCIIWNDGQVIYQESYGYKNLETQELMTIDAIFRIASMTKPITSVLAMILWEEKKLDLDDPITRWFPQFKNMRVQRIRHGEYEEANRQITILDLLTHRSGFTYNGYLGGDIDSELTNEEWINGLAGIPLACQPGGLFNYGRSTDLLGILISTIEGKSLGKVMEEKLFNPLTMHDTFFDVPNNKRNRRASNFGYDESGNVVSLETVPLNMAFKERPNNLEFESGGQGLWSTVGDYLKFAKIFVENGCSNGIQILKPETIELICSNQLTDSQREHSKFMGSRMFREHYGFGLGLAVALKENKYGSMPCTASVGSVGWPGAYGGWWSANPMTKTISIFLTHSMVELKQLEQGVGFELFEAIEVFSNYSKVNS